MRLNQITLPCTDETFRACLDFWQRFGLRLIVHTHDAYARFECPEGDGAPATLSLHVEADAHTGPGASVYFEVGDVAAEAERLSRAGITLDAPPVEQSWLWTEAWLSDPAGNRVCVYHAGEARRFPPWRKV